MGAENKQMSMNGSISVSTEKINDSVIRMRRLYSSALKHIENIRNCVVDAKSFWSDEGSEIMLKLFSEDEKNSHAVTEEIKTRIANLDEISAVYSRTEAAAAESAETLPDNIIDW